MCDDFIHQGLTHDPTVSRRAFGLGATAAALTVDANLSDAKSYVAFLHGQPQTDKK